MNNGQAITVTPLIAGSLESAAIPKGAAGVFFDLSKRSRDARTLAKVTTKEWGKEDVAMNLPEQFDGAILLDAATPPAYRRNLPGPDAATVPLP
jgi:erythromycin esterase-like protein